MTPAGYLLKHVVPPPGWLVSSPTHIKQVCSVSGCVNETVVDPSETWQHNSFGLSNTADLLSSIALEKGIDVAGAELYFYDAYELELASDGWDFDPLKWRQRMPDPSASIADAVARPGESQSVILLGYDVVVIDYGFFHSPLSCNGIAGEMGVNEHCLLNDFDEALEAIDSGRFGGGCEEGRYTIFAVQRVDCPPPR